jgi:hypothetical protein
MMDYVDVLRDSVETSVAMKLFKNVEEAMKAHIFKSKLVKVPLGMFKNVDNFNPNRLQKTAQKAYPIDDRPRGKDDILSIKYYQKKIRNGKDIPQIWMIKKRNKYILLDGAHRVVASYIEGKPHIYAHIIM